jgi:flagellar hook-associated protein 2
MPTNSVTSSIIQTLGAGSGIDMTALAESLAAAQFAARIDRNTARAELVERQISEAASLKSMVLQLASGVGERLRTGDLSAQPAIGNGSVASVSRGAASGNGSYTLEVTALAAAQTLTSPAYAAATTPTGSGSLTLRFGTISGSSFAEDTAHPATTVTIASGATLTDVAAAINAANAGVSAYVATGTNGAQLMLKGSEGAANAFILEATETVGDEGLAALAWTPAAALARRLASSADAAFKLDGLEMTSASNRVADIVPGLNLALTGINPGAPTTIRFSEPTAAVSTFMADLTAALNEVVGALKTQVNPQGGDLARDSGARAMKQALAQLAGSTIMTGGATSQPTTLADLGLATNRDGTFRLDGARLTATLKSSPAGIAAMFTTGVRGVFATLDRMTRTLTSASDPGSLTGSVGRYTALKTRLAVEANKLTEAQEELRARMVTRFAGVDSRVGASRSTLSFLQNQIDAWNAQRN